MQKEDFIDADFANKLKERIVQLMQRDGMSNTEFAKKTGISLSSLSHIMAGRNKPSLEIVMRIYKAYPNIDLHWLLGEESRLPEEKAQIADLDLFSGAHENRKNTGEDTDVREFSKEMPVQSTENIPKISVKEVIKYVEKPTPKIREIRIFFDNGTYETFKPTE